MNKRDNFVSTFLDNLQKNLLLSFRFYFLRWQWAATQFLKGTTHLGNFLLLFLHAMSQKRQKLFCETILPVSKINYILCFFYLQWSTYINNKKRIITKLRHFHFSLWLHINFARKCSSEPFSGECMWAFFNLSETFCCHTRCFLELHICFRLPGEQISQWKKNLAPSFYIFICSFPAKKQLLTLARLSHKSLFCKQKEQGKFVE